ncbi:distal tail protein Dit [Metabacillus arenae]|uniref:Phage tail family protein n=1 Tax=Metabacillus arenae TaxID=2771434 RepID=A0A926N9I4_9BACI|nr:distal tail protein Dit [Metabacillus arenae]MBD1379229.1 phage tail family protein [Metabacillus arenae]
MIRESLYFTFDGRKSSDFGILNISINAGLFEEQLFSNRSIREFTIRGRNKPYFIEVEKEPKTIPMSFAFEDKYNDRLIRNIVQWLNVDYYKPLAFSENLDIVFYAMPVGDNSLIHNGLKQGYVNLNMRCDSPNGYGRDIATPLYTTTSPTFKGTVIIDNLGDEKICPNIYIEKIGNGDLTIENYAIADNTFKFTGLIDKEIIKIDSENEIIETNIPNTFRYDNFNDNHLVLQTGKNILHITGDCKIKFHYRFKYL